MVDVWTDVNALDAEARLRGLRRRLTELDGALTEQQALLRDYPDSFAFRMGVNSLLRMDWNLRSELASILRHRVHEKVELVLSGPYFAYHSARLTDLGVLFSRFQKLYSSIAQAITSGPTLRGPISATVRHKTDLRLHATFASSFGMELYVPSSFDLLGSNLSSDALQQLFQLLQASTSEHQLMPVSGAIGRRALVHLRSLASLLTSTQSELRLGWKDFAGTQYEWEVATDGAADLIRAIDNITETRSDTREVAGLLVGASLLRDRFEIVLDSGALIEGKFVAGIGSDVQAAFGKRVSATVDETEMTDRASGEVRTYHALKRISLFPD